jgi:hypothetical protein
LIAEVQDEHVQIADAPKLTSNPAQLRAQGLGALGAKFRCKEAQGRSESSAGDAEIVEVFRVQVLQRAFHVGLHLQDLLADDFSGGERQQISGADAEGGGKGSSGLRKPKALKRCPPEISRCGKQAEAIAQVCSQVKKGVGITLKNADRDQAQGPRPLGPLLPGGGRDGTFGPDP